MRSDLAELLCRADQADHRAADELFAALYSELRRLAERHLERGGGNLTLSRTTLVHDAYLSMIGQTDAKFPDRARFFAYASRAMRGLVVDYARRRRAKKRGRDYEITLVEDEVSTPATIEAGQDLDALSDALVQLTDLDAALAELVDLHFFGGFSFVEIAGLRGVFDLRAFVAHYSESDQKLRDFDITQLEPLLQGTVLPTLTEILSTRDPLLTGVVFPAGVIDEVTEFMKALTDPAARNLQHVVPQRVPSGLPVDGALGG